MTIDRFSRKPLRFVSAMVALTISSLALRLTAATGAEAEPSGTFAAAVADLRAEWARIEGVATTEAHLIEVNERFFSRVELAALGPREIAEIVRLNAFAYGDKTHVLAACATERMNTRATAPDADGALAAALCVSLGGHAGIAGPVRAEWAKRYLQHPALVALLRSEFGDLALDVACRTARTEAEREFVLGLVEQLDPTGSPVAALTIPSYWRTIQRWVPEGERRQALRGRLADYLAAVLAAGKDAAAIPGRRETLETQLAVLNGADARGTLRGAVAPEIHFVWSSRPEWKVLSDLRGKVVVLDFWATWCGPCVGAFPKIGRLAERYRGYDVEVVGVTSVFGSIVGLRSGVNGDCRGDPAREMRLMTDYIQERAITWPVVFSREPVFNPDYGVRGIPSVVILAPDGTVRHSAPGGGEAADFERIDALLAEFGRPVPPKNGGS